MSIDLNEKRKKNQSIINKLTERSSLKRMPTNENQADLSALLSGLNPFGDYLSAYGAHRRNAEVIRSSMVTKMEPSIAKDQRKRSKHGKVDWMPNLANNDPKHERISLDEFSSLKFEHSQSMLIIDFFK